MTLVVATTNPHKLREIRQLLDGVPCTVESIAALARIPEPAETGATFADNARIKALAYARHVPHLTVAEDSGLAIDALDGAPGIHSARYPGDTYPEKFRRLYAELRARGVRTSSARFVCAVAIVEAGRVVLEATGVVEGRIAETPRGEAGFGYDPIFYYPPCGCTLAELSAARKASISHRGQAFAQVRAFLLARAATGAAC